MNLRLIIEKNQKPEKDEIILLSISYPENITVPILRTTNVKDLIKFIDASIKEGLSSENVETVLIDAIRYNYLEIIEHVMNTYRLYYNIDKLFTEANKYSRIDIVVFLIKYKIRKNNCYFLFSSP